VNAGEQLALIGVLALALMIGWVAWQIRKLHEDLQPVIDSTIVQALSRV
jgi:predicted negative regulator of RcsB-dependent stress response